MSVPVPQVPVKPVAVNRQMPQFATFTIYLLTTGIGVVALLYPFWLPSVVQTGQGGMAHAQDAPLILTLLVGLAFAVLLLEVQTAAGSAKTVALLGVLVAINSILRFVDVAIPGPGGFSPIFVLIILGGYIFGGRIGFLLGVMTLLVSALITGAVGPWLPYQMFTAGWIGLSAPLCRPLVRALGAEGRAGEIWVLAIFGAIWGIIFGIIINLWFWPFVAGSASQYWQPGIGVWATVQRYMVFYAATSLVWDSSRALGNALLILAFGAAILRVLRRFHRRFVFHYAPAPVRAPVVYAPALTPTPRVEVQP
jgi:energy-coupling factor transport system substrate-specific component